MEVFPGLHTLLFKWGGQPDKVEERQVRQVFKSMPSDSFWLFNSVNVLPIPPNIIKEKKEWCSGFCLESPKWIHRWQKPTSTALVWLGWGRVTRGGNRLNFQNLVHTEEEICSKHSKLSIQFVRQLGRCSVQSSADRPGAGNLWILCTWKEPEDRRGATLHHRLKAKKLPQQAKVSVYKGNANRSEIHQMNLCRQKAWDGGQADAAGAAHTGCEGRCRRSPATQVSCSHGR